MFQLGFFHLSFLLWACEIYLSWRIDSKFSSLGDTSVGVSWKLLKTVLKLYLTTSVVGTVTKSCLWCAQLLPATTSMLADVCSVSFHMKTWKSHKIMVLSGRFRSFWVSITVLRWITLLHLFWSLVYKSGT